MGELIIYVGGEYWSCAESIRYSPGTASYMVALLVESAGVDKVETIRYPDIGLETVMSCVSAPGTGVVHGTGVGVCVQLLVDVVQQFDVQVDGGVIENWIVTLRVICGQFFLA